MRCCNKLILFPLLAFLVSLLTVKSFAQTPVFINYTYKEGLVDNEVYKVIQDSKGFIWMATQMGICRFDGVTFKQYNFQEGLINQAVLDIIESYDNQIWFITFSGKLFFIKDDSVKAYKYNSVLENIFRGRPFYLKNTLSISKNMVCFSLMNNGLITINTEGKVTIKKPEHAKEIWITNPQSPLYLISSCQSDSLVIRYNNKKLSVALENSSQTINHAFVSVLSANKIAFSENKTVYFINKKGIENTISFSQRIIYLYYDHKGVLWVGTFNDGVYGLVQNNKGFFEQRFHFLNGHSVSSVCYDSEDGYWFSTLDEGVFYFPNIQVFLLNSTSGFPFNALREVEPGENNNFYVISGKVVYKGNIEGKNKVIQIVNKNDEIITSIAESGNTLYLSTNASLYLLEKGTLRKLYPRPNNPSSIVSFKYLQSDGQGGVWAGGVGCLIHYSKGNVIKFSDVNNAGLRVNCFYVVSDKEIYLGCTDGLWKISHSKLVYEGTLNTALNDWITDIYYDSTNSCLYVGTLNKGMVVKQNKQYFTLTTNDGLSSNTILSIAPVGDNIWLATQKGLNRMVIYSGLINSFIVYRNISSEFLQMGKIYKIRYKSGKLWLATQNGLGLFDISNLSKNKYRPPVYFTKINAISKKNQASDNLVLSYSGRNIEFAFQGISFKGGKNITYLYRLKPHHEQWQYTTENRVSFSRLPPGNYKFEVYAVSPEGFRGEKPAICYFSVDYALWQKWWFYLLLLTTIGALIFTLYLFHTMRVKRRRLLNIDILNYRQDALARQMNPHFIFNSLNSIQRYILENDSKSSAKYLTKFAQLMRMILEFSQNQTISLDQEIESLQLYLELEKMRFKDRLSFTINVDKSLTLTMTRIPTFLIQPYVENSIWHGLGPIKEDGFLHIWIRPYQNKYIRVIIEDNGIGRKKARELKANSSIHESQGNSITRSRMDLLNSLYDSQMTVEYTDIYDSDGVNCGTRVTINIIIVKPEKQSELLL